MKLLQFAIFLMLLMPSSLKAQKQSNAILGVWESDKKDGRMEIFKDGNKYSGRLLWGNQAVEADGKTSKKDLKNPNQSLRSRNIIGITNLTGLTWDGEEFVDGKIYDPTSGKTYACKLWVEDGKLHMRGFMGVSMLGKTVLWHRYPVKG